MVLRAAGLLAVLLLMVLRLWLVQGRAVDYGRVAGVVMAPDSAAGALFRIQHVAISTTAGRSLACRLRTPVALEPGRRVPAVLLAGGRRTGSNAVRHLDVAFTTVALACDYPWAALARLRGAAFVRRLPKIRAEIVATPQVLSLAATVLADQPEADTTRLLALGASLGVPPVAAWAGADPRVRAVALLYGGARLDRVLEANLEEDVPWRVARRPVAWALGRALRPLEPGRTVGLIAPRPLLIVAGADDGWIPRGSVEALYTAAGEPKRLVWLRGEHVRTTNEALLGALSDTVRAWLTEVLPGPTSASSPPAAWPHHASSRPSSSPRGVSSVPRASS